MRFLVPCTLLLVVCSAHSWSIDMVRRSQGPQIQRSFMSSNAQCFGLARRTRQKMAYIPVLYNSRTQQVSPIPKFLYSVDQSLIMRLENEGWEVRSKRTFIPHMEYERVPVCCPWDQRCNQGDQSQSAPSPAARGPCANGGQVTVKDGVQRCECPAGFRGAWCQIPDLIGKYDPDSTTPYGPRIPVASTQGPYNGMQREAEMWKRMHAMMSQAGPMLSAKDHLLASVAGPWAQNAAMWHYQVMRAKMAALQAMNNYYQGARNPYSQIPNQGMSPYEMIKIIQRNGGNTYSSQASNPHSNFQSPGQLPPSVMRALYDLQNNRQQQNPYNRMPQEFPNRQILALIHRMRKEQRQTNPYNNIAPHNANGMTQGGNSYNQITAPVPTYGNRQQEGMRGPQARTPWDLDPFSQQQNPNFMNDRRVQGGNDRDRQLLAAALYRQHMMNQQRAGWSNGNDDMVHSSMNSAGYPRPPMAVPTNNVYSDQDDTNYDQLPTDVPQPPIADDQVQKDMPTAPQTVMGGHLQGQPQMPEGRDIMQSQPQMPMGGPPRDGPMNGQPQMQRPTQEEIRQMQECKATLEPELDDCLTSYEISMQDFMNPEFMEKAKPVCENSTPVGQCIMKKDHVCGDGSAVLISRKMINSVLQMMGMVCQQIMARGGQPIPPMENLQGAPQAPLGSAPAPPMPPTPPAGIVEEEFRPSVANDLAEEPIPESENPAPTPTEAGKESKFTTADSGNGITPKAAASSASKSNGGHDAAHPVSKEIDFLGYPLWLIITFALVLFVVLVLVVVVVCMCVRRRRRTKSAELQKEIEAIPQPLDNKMCTIGIPPPSYTTTPVQQNSDDFSLPPLDLSEDSVSVPIDEKVNEKPPLEEDADDESDDKEDQETKKKSKDEK